MKKLLISTALVLTISTNANAYDRFLKLRNSQPSVEVNYGALKYIQEPMPMGEISAQTRPEKIVKRPVKPAKGTEHKPAVSKAVELEKPAPAPEKAVEAPKPIEIQKPAPAPEMPAISKPETAPAPLLEPFKSPDLNKLEAPAPEKLPELKMPEKLPEKPLEMPKLSEIKLPEPIKAPAPAAISAPAFPPITPPTTTNSGSTTASNTVVLPPLFPNGSDAKTAPTAITPPPAPAALPPLQNLLKDNNDNIEIPKLPNTGGDNSSDLANVPAPKITDVQVKTELTQPTQIAQAPSAQETSFSFPFNETETELPLAEQTRLLEVATILKSNPNMEMTVNSFASGSEEQSSQSKRTSLSRALSVRRFMLEQKVESKQIIIRPNGNNSGNGLPDRVDIQVSKKVGA
jgi:outer membrane protein OmpA-like peptidoglycan-associated protein